MSECAKNTNGIGGLRMWSCLNPKKLVVPQ